MSHKITDKCKGCDDCAEICRVRAITGEMKEMHEIDPNRCIDCGACCNVCEYESIRDQFDRPTKYTPKENWKKPVIDAKLCNGCSLCVEDCPAYALEITPPEQPGDVHHSSVLARPDDCNACGMCERRCPVGAISMK